MTMSNILIYLDMGNSVVESRKAAVQRYVDILTDAGLKAVFGDQRNKDVLIDLLNVILPPHKMVADISYETTEIPGFTLFNKSVRFDLRCRGVDGRQFIVELQCYHQANFFRRCVLYASKAFDMGSQRGDGGVTGRCTTSLPCISSVFSTRTSRTFRSIRRRTVSSRSIPSVKKRR